MKNGKIWGTTTLIMKTPFFRADILKIVPNAHCSKHKHQYMHNLFYVLSGHLQVEIWKDYGLKDITHLKAGEKVCVQPNEYHRFVTGSEPCECLEFYFPQEISEDIVRETVGGVSYHNTLGVTDNLT